MTENLDPCLCTAALGAAVAAGTAVVRQRRCDVTRHRWVGRRLVAVGAVALAVCVVIAAVALLWR